MAHMHNAVWEADLASNLSRRDRRGGPYEAYVPDTVASRPVVIPPDLAQRAANTERAIRALASRPGAAGLSGIARFLLRSEAIASSMIEGIAPSPAQVAIAELSHNEDVRGFSDQAALVANNITVLRRATQEMGSARELSTADIVSLHAALLPNEQQHRGFRTVKNWIGGSNWHPLDADFVPPPHDEVLRLMTDLAVYLNGATHGPLIQAGLAHAQFETIHPFTDGNGRVGRALIHTVMSRGGLASDAILPISMVLSTRSNDYVRGLSAYRYIGDALSDEAVDGIATWLTVFIEAAAIAVNQALGLASDIAALQEQWALQLRNHRVVAGLRAEPRANSASSRLLDLLPEAPVLTTKTVQRILEVSFPSARAALEELADGGILSRKSLDRGTTGYLALDVLDLIGLEGISGDA
ncbi:Fic family protein [Gordonia rubripertincta]|uniref:Fic family protein n=1 Tax=Gordonia rubripertincta TaxID=36822 RepID=A0ABT4MYW8_GORRU|nr:Fic family protein [Gordonia rubripertincta]MCZ4552194.1 Fic family protein [Gordonia rubripertincta]